MIYKRLVVMILLIGAILVSGTAMADVLYTLTPGTTYQEGCFGPCLCPVGISDGVTGTFTLVPEGSDQSFTSYHLDEISWTVIGLSGETVYKITGQGIYRLGGVPIMHQLTLDISVNGAEAVHLDSGLVPGGADFPAISINVAHGACFGFRMAIGAAPANVVNWAGPLSFPIKITSVEQDSSGNIRFSASTGIFNGTIELSAELSSGEVVWVPDTMGCYITLSSADGMGLCIKAVVSVATDISKSRTDRILFVGTGDFSRTVEATTVTGIGHLDSKGIFKKDSMGSISSISLDGQIAGGIDNTSLFSGNFKATLTPVK
jgi:hypothetical protein